METQGPSEDRVRPKTRYLPEDREPRGGDAKLRVLSLDGGGIKGLTSLLMLRRIMRTMKIEGSLDEEPRPCDVFDVIGGTSTGGLIAVMLGRLGMTVEECIAEYKRCGRLIFSKPPRGGGVSKIFFSAVGKSWYSADNLCDQVKKTISNAGRGLEEPFLEATPICRTFVCVTRNKTGAAEVLRNYETHAANQEDFDCYIWEPGCATAAAPFYFDSISLTKNKESFSDGGMNRNNPIREALAECHRIWPHRNFGSVVSLGTGWVKSAEVSERVDKFMMKCIEMLKDSEKIAADFESEKFATDLMKANGYFRFNVQQGMQELKLSDYKEEEKMSALTNQYLARCGPLLKACAQSLLDPGEEYSSRLVETQAPLPVELCQNYRLRSHYAQWLRDFYAESRGELTRVAIWGLGGTGKTQIAIQFALEMVRQSYVFWIRADTPEHFILDYGQISEKLRNSDVSVDHLDIPQSLKRAKESIECSLEPIILVIDNADSADVFLESTIDGIDLGASLPSRGFTIFTTRDVRFVGSVVSTQNGLNVKPMEVGEGSDLFMASLPQNLVRPTDQAFRDQLEWLLNELGCLPLAIAQAAATMRECRMSIERLVELFEDAKTKAKILRQPIKGLKNHAQSVLLTWEVTLSQIEISNPHAAKLLMALACFHWSAVPVALLTQLECVADVDRYDMAAAVGTLVNFSIAEQNNAADSFPELQVHPMVHFWIEQRLPKEEILVYLLDVLRLIAAVYGVPTVLNRLVNTYLLPHAIRVIHLSEVNQVELPQLARLLQNVASFFADKSFYGTALEFVNKAEKMSLIVWPQNSASRYLIKKTKARILRDATRYREAEALYRAVYSMLTSVEDNSIDVEEEKRVILQELVQTLTYTRSLAEDGWFSIAGDPLFHELERLDVSDFKAVDLHNLANAFWRLKKLDLCEKLSQMAMERVLEGEKVPEETFLAMRNMQGHIKCDKGLKDEAVEIYLSVFERSFQILDKRDLNLWVNAVNVCSLFSQLSRWSEIDDILIRLFEGWDDTLEGRALTRAGHLVNMLGVSFQRQGRTEEGRMLHHYALRLFQRSLSQSDTTRSEAEDQETWRPGNIDAVWKSDLELALYNIAMSYVREGNWDAAAEFRPAQGGALARAEAQFGSLEKRRAEFEADRQAYQEARMRLQTKSRLPAEGEVPYEEWYEQHRDALERAILFFGPLEPVAVDRGPGITPPSKEKSVNEKEMRVEMRQDRAAEQKRSRRFREVFGRFSKGRGTSGS